MEDLLDLPVRALATAVREKQISSKNLVTAFLDRIGKNNPRLNAMVCSIADIALKNAQKADSELAQGNLRGKLHGVPFTIKDSLDTKDAISTWGTLGRAEFRPGSDATCVARLRDAGGILLGKTNTPEFTLSFETDNLVYGRTNNPYDLACTPGGSSGGAAALIASHSIPFDIGTDTGGSIRLPAHFTGICGIKPSMGLVPRTGNALPTSGILAPLTQIGPMARHVDDLIYLLPLISGPDFIDPATVAQTMSCPDDMDPGTLRIGYFTDNGIKAPCSDTLETVSRVVQLLRDQKLEVNEARPTGIEMTHFITSRLFAMDGPTLVGNLLDDSRTTEPADYIKAILEVGSGAPGDSQELSHLVSLWHNYQSSMLEYFVSHDILICPVNSGVAVPHQTTGDLSGYTYTSAFNLTGWPVVVIRAGTTASGLPVGIQIAAAPFQDHVALAMARWLELNLGEFPGPA
jgi:amidase